MAVAAAATLNVTELFATNDGQFFIDENRALLHATPNKLSVFQLAIPEAAELETKTNKVASKLAAHKGAADNTNQENTSDNKLMAIPGKETADKTDQDNTVNNTSADEMIEHEVSEDDIINNPDLQNSDIKAGDEISFLPIKAEVKVKAAAGKVAPKKVAPKKTAPKTTTDNK